MDKFFWLATSLIVFGVILFTLSHIFRKALYRYAMRFEAARGNLKEHHIEVEGCKYCYFDNHNTDAKETLVLLHGFAATKENWLRFAAKLKTQFRIIAVDLAGHGKSFKDINLSYDLDEQAQRLNQLTQALNIDCFHLAGNSMGGAITCMYASMYPEKVLTAILLNPAGGEIKESELDQRISNGKNTLIVESDEDFKEVFQFTMSNRPYFPSAVKRATGEVYSVNKVINHKIWQDFRVQPHNYDFIRQLTKITCPALVVWGKKDRVLHPDNIASFTQNIKHNQSVLYDNVGHLPMIEIPRKLAKQLLSFIDQASQTKCH